MKKLFTSAAIALMGMTAFAQPMACCHISASSSTEKFAMFVNDDKFNNMHPTPLEYIHVSQAGGKMITFKTKGVDANGYLLEAKTKTDKWIFVFQEWWGLNDNIKREAENLYGDLGNVNVLAIDMYDGKVASTREDAGAYMKAFTQERGNEIVNGALAYVGKDAKVATIGWCFGGGQSMQAALTAGKQAIACVIYYGMPEENLERLKTLNCDVLDIFATQDQWINKEVTERFEKNMKAAGKKLTVKSYDADHAFANPSNPKHDEKITADAYKNSLEFLKARLK